MKRFGTTTRIALAMAMWTATVLLGLRMLGVLNDGTAEQTQARTRLCESVAVGCSQFASRDDMPAIEVALQTLAGRNPDVVSAGCRQSDGELIVEVGDHMANWQLLETDESTTTCIKVPVMQGAELWGQVEVCFESPVTAGLFGFLQLPSVKTTLIAALANLMGFLFLLRRCFNHLDPSQAVPTRVRSALNTMAEGILVLDGKNRINLANEPFAEMLGREADDLQGASVDSLEWKISCDLSFSEFLVARDDDEGAVPDSVQLRLEDDRVRTLKVGASRIENEQGECQGTLLSFDDITALEEKNEQLQFLATRDPMTSCLNRRSFFEHLDASWKSASRYKHPISCMMVDVDHFKSVNDTYGHAVGDDVLKGVSAALLEAARETDFVCRYGGEEFCVLLPHVDIDGVALAGERYRKAIEALEFPQLSVTASLGCSSIELGAESAEQMLEQADKSLYFAKRNGRNQVGRFDQIGSAEDDSSEEVNNGDELSEEESLLQSIQSLMSDAREAGNTSVSFDRLTEMLGKQS